MLSCMSLPNRFGVPVCLENNAGLIGAASATFPRARTLATNRSRSAQLSVTLPASKQLTTSL